MKTDKKILDACCGSRMMWFDKACADAVFMDIRYEELTACDGRSIEVKPEGILIFKWNEEQIKIRQILDIIPYKPLFGHPTSNHGKTIWMCFMKR